MNQPSDAIRRPLDDRPMRRPGHAARSHGRQAGQRPSRRRFRGRHLSRIRRRRHRDCAGAGGGRRAAAGRHDSGRGRSHAPRHAAQHEPGHDPAVGSVGGRARDRSRCAGGVATVLAGLRPPTPAIATPRSAWPLPAAWGTSTRPTSLRQPPADLLAAMRLAADRDLVARQYAEDFGQVFDCVVPWLAADLGVGPVDAARGDRSRPSCV